MTESDTEQLEVVEAACAFVDALTNIKNPSLSVATLATLVESVMALNEAEEEDDEDQ
jgi:hypothetical protein